MVDINDITEDMTVVGSDGEHVGTVDKVEGDQIKLTKNDSPNGQHNFISVDLVDSVDGDTVTLSQTAEDAIAEFDDEGSDEGEGSIGRASGSVGGS